MSPWSRARSALTAGAVALTLTAAAACGTAGPAGAGGGSGELALWTLENEGINAVQQAAVDAFNQGEGADIELSTYVNDPYKAALQTAIGSPNASDIFYNWGGGNLQGYVDAGQVADLTAALDANPEVRDAFLPSVLDVGTIDGQVYGIPMQGVQPVSFFYNKDVFAAAGIAEFPRTWTEFLDVIERLKAAGIQPIALAGSQPWTELMYLEYLLDRVGGPEKFQAIVDGTPGAWSDPAVVTSLQMIRELVDRGAFGTNFAAVNYDNQGSQALLTSGRAAMELMGSWEVTSLNDNFPDFLEAGTLGWADFPAVESGTGNPANIVGNPSNFYSVTSSSSDVDAATRFLMEHMTSDAYVQGMIDVGQVPAIEGLEEEVAVGEFADFNSYVYETVQNAPTFTQSWDQALPADVAQAMLTNLSQVFLGQITPEEFGAAMEASAQ
ncbi:extracellular solute-binding protein [Pseudonocardia nigra]|uniref:extracellular solute-binding protein n=1 Tax=Pseudonocardia nigra TaxID=1921578 RepID=UPI001C5FA5B0|nr:extracellular solute-binding protein [Pseudonocardia nigra]